ncbi:hypothetical protein [Cryobacterium suzukii]|uniref:hypothetical protein n=1 Tax=Cryobacterium suzukii TaxID=1259198 RepID=UPI00141B4393|nr:hypothetical protein [Cryobacterium suzukii]
MALLDGRIIAHAQDARWVIAEDDGNHRCRIGKQELEYSISLTDGLWRIDTRTMGIWAILFVSNERHAVESLMLWYAGVAAQGWDDGGPTPYSRRRYFDLPLGVGLRPSGEGELRLEWGNGSWANFPVKQYNRALDLGQVVLSSLDEIETSLQAPDGRPLFMSVGELQDLQESSDEWYSPVGAPASWAEYVAWKEEQDE